MHDHGVGKKLSAESGRRPKLQCLVAASVALGEMGCHSGLHPAYDT